MQIDDEKTAAQTMLAAGEALWLYWVGELKDVLAPVFAQASSRNAAFDYVRGLFAEGARRSCWQLAELAGHLTPRRLQALLGEHRWDYRVLLDRLRELVVAHLGDVDAALVLDETAELKRGEHTVGVHRQYAGLTGQVELCQVVVFLAYVSSRAHALFDFLLYLPAPWADDPERRRQAKVPEDVVFETKPQLAVRLLARAVAAAVPFAWVLADEVYGRANALRTYVEGIGRGYLLAIPVDFQAVFCPGALPTPVSVAAASVPEDNWQARSCGKGCKGHRYYEWALLATVSATHWVLLRRHPERRDQITYFYVFIPPQRTVTLAQLVRLAGTRWPIEECFQQGKGQVGLDQHQVRTWHSFHRHTTLAMLALAAIAIATAVPAAPATPAAEPATPKPQPTTPEPATPEPSTSEPPTPEPSTSEPATPTPPAQPTQWRDSAPLPNHPDQPPPEDPGLVAVSVPEGRRLLNLATATLTTIAKAFALHWSNWRRRHQARARWHHYRRRLRAAMT